MSTELVNHTQPVSIAALYISCTCNLGALKQTLRFFVMLNFLRFIRLQSCHTLIISDAIIQSGNSHRHKQIVGNDKLDESVAGCKPIYYYYCCY